MEPSANTVPVPIETKIFNQEGEFGISFIKKYFDSSGAVAKFV